MKILATTPLPAAYAAHRAALKALSAATEKSLPIGTRIQAQLGRHLIEGIVQGHGFWWSRPSWITVLNVKTGKPRSFNAAHESYALVIVEANR